MARAIRIVLLLLVLATVAQQTWLARVRATSWEDPLRVAIYPLNGDGSAAAQRYMAGLTLADFQPIERFFKDESKRHGLALHQPLRLTLAPGISILPPAPPHGGSPLDVIAWSLQLRWWSWRNDTAAKGDKPQVRLYVLFFDPIRNHVLPHSTGLDRGMIGIVNAFATPVMAGSNNVVIAHELLHTLGATDKYDLATNQPSYPDGYADPQRTPRLPQEHAEIMAGRIPKSATQADIPDDLDATVIGPRTAAEIGWQAGNAANNQRGKP